MKEKTSSLIDTRVLIKTNYMLSFTGIVQKTTDENTIVLKCSDTSSILIVIPVNEITKVFTMDAEVRLNNV